MSVPIDTSSPESADLSSSRDTDALSGVPAPLAEAMRKRGFSGLTSVQSAVLGAASTEHDLRVSSQTGSGKTVAIGLVLAPGLIGDPTAQAAKRRGPSVLILVPTRELAMQVRDELHWLFAGVPGVDTEVVMGGTSTGLERRALSRLPRIVVATPGRALDHLRTRSMRGDDVTHVVLDESDRMLDMGFREELEAILEQMPADRRTHMVSATFPVAVRKLADRFQRNVVHLEGTKLGAANRDIEHIVHVVDRAGSYAAVVNHLLLNEGQRCLIFVERRADVAALTERLATDGFLVQAFSGELAQAQRTRTLNSFRDGTMKTLVSTDVAARGIDVPGIELVIHVTLPESADTYVHRSGRTGRAGSAGRSVMLVAPQAQQRARRILAEAGIEAEWTAAPNASRVEKTLRKRFRQQLHEVLAAEQGPSQTQIDYAKQLLDGRDAATVVAVLLELAQPRPARPPMEVREPAARSADEPSERESEYVPFKINWGSQAGAAPNRLLSHVCRRGQVKGDHVGGIRVGPHESTFQVAASVAARFEKLVRRPDPREPKLRIVRAGAAKPLGKRPPRPRPGPKTGWKDRSAARPERATSPKASERPRAEGRSKAAEGKKKRPPRPR